MKYNALQIQDFHQRLKTKYQQRDAVFDSYLDYFVGDHKIMFRFEESSQEVPLVINMIASSVKKQVDYLSPSPEIQVPLPLPDVKYRAFADKIEKFLYANWLENNFELTLMTLEFFQSLFGMAFIRQVESPKTETKVVISSPFPKNVYPVFNHANLTQLLYCSFEWKSYDLIAGREVEWIEFWTLDEYYLLEDGKMNQAFNHGLEFIPVQMILNFPENPVRSWESDVANVVGLNDYLNRQYDNIGIALDYAADPTLVTRGTKQARFGRGGHIELERDGSAEYLPWPGGPPTMEAQIMRTQQAIEDETNVGEPVYARAIPSGISGQTIRTLSSGIQSALRRKQVFLGPAISQMNKFTLKMIEKDYADKEIYIQGTRKGDTFAEVIKGKEIQGYYRNIIIFKEPMFERTQRYGFELDKMKNKLQSKYSTAVNVGIVNPSLELEMIKKEEEEAEKPALDRVPVRPGREEVSPEVLRRLAEFRRVPKPAQGEGGSSLEEEDSAEEGSSRIELDELIRLLKKIKKLRDKAVIFGGIVVEGYTNRDIDMYVPNAADRQTILNSIPIDWRKEKRIHFVDLKGKMPQVAYVVIEGGEAKTVGEIKHKGEALTK